MVPEPVSARLASQIEQLRRHTEKFLRDHFAVESLNQPGSAVYVISPRGDLRYAALPPEAQASRHLLLQEYDRVRSLVTAVTAKAAPSVAKTIRSSLAEIRQFLTRSSPTSHRTSADAIEALAAHAKHLTQVLAVVFPATSSSCNVIPDTNALYGMPDFQSWSLPDIPRFDICLAPAVLQELDEHKLFHRNADISRKAADIIRRIKEMRRRGPLTEGVDVVSGKVRLRAIAVEPRSHAPLSWLDMSVADDRLIASAVTLMQSEAGAPAIILTADVNLQNKCDFAGIQYSDLPSVP